MVNKPLTEQDFEYPRLIAIKEKVQSAKRLLKEKMSGWNYTEQINRIIDACFQIKDGDDDK
jgi:hypothetical protein